VVFFCFALFLFNFGGLEYIKVQGFLTPKGEASSVITCQTQSRGKLISADSLLYEKKIAKNKQTLK